MGAPGREEYRIKERFLFLYDGLENVFVLPELVLLRGEN